MPTYSLWYFNFRGRAEVPRLIMKEAGIEFEDRRVPFEDWFQKLKPSKNEMINYILITLHIVCYVRKNFPY